MQCGWPMHKFCYKKSDMVRVKCPQHTTSCAFCHCRAVQGSATTSTPSPARGSRARMTPPSKTDIFVKWQRGKGLIVYVYHHSSSSPPVASFDCAWCAKTGFQCLPDRWNGPDSRDGSRCSI